MEKCRILSIILVVRLNIRHISIFPIVLLSLAVCVAAPARTLTEKNHHKYLSRALNADRGVILYFYADAIEDSLEHFPAFQKLAAKHPKKVAVFKVNAQKDMALQELYGVVYAPTVFAIRPGEGIVEVQEVDIKPKKLVRVLTSKKRKPPWGDLVGLGEAADKPSLLFFMADWCGYCLKLIPQVKRFRSDFGDRVNVQTIDVDREVEFSKGYFIEELPTFVVLDINGLIRERLPFAGYEDYVKSLRRAGAKLRKKSG